MASEAGTTNTAASVGVQAGAGAPPPATPPSAVTGPGAIPAPGGGARPRSNTKLFLLIAVCLAPVLASYLAYYVFPPTGRTNYGELIDPQITLAALDPTDPLGRFKGQWILVTVQDGPCDRACAERLFFMRQTHTALGRERDRVDMVMLQAGAGPLSAELVAAHPKLAVIDTTPATITRWFPAGAEGRSAGHLYVVDPQHNLMMRFPLEPDPARARKDLQRLLKASRIG